MKPDKTINCAIATPEKMTNYQSLASLVLPADSGEMQVLPGHAECFVLLQKGEIVLHHQSGEKNVLAIDGGECHIENNLVQIIL
jgi:F0F1-type ATP synthase epsilon subunit